MWNATIHEVQKGSGNVTVAVLFASETEKFVENFVVPPNSPPEWLTQAIRARIITLGNSDAFAASLQKGEEIDTTDVVSPPSKEEDDRVVFRQKVFAYMRLKQLADLEIIPKDALTAPLAELKTLYKAGYTI